MNEVFKNYVEEKKKNLVGNDRFTIIIEEPKDILSEEEIDDLIKCYARMLAYEYIGAHPELFQKPDDASRCDGEDKIMDSEAIFSGELCAIIDDIEDGGEIRCAV